MKTEALRHVRRLWTNPLAPREINRANQIKWVRAVRMLGDKWLLAKHVNKLNTGT